MPHNLISTFFSITLTLFFVIDALGKIPQYRALLEPLEPKRRRKIAARELFFALIIMVLFHYVGEFLLTILGISKTTVQIAGGTILFLIAIRLIFSEEGLAKWGKKEPFIVPIATPLIASPSLLAIIMIFAQDMDSDFIVLGAIFASWLLSAIVFFFSGAIYSILKDKGSLALQRLMGLIVAMVAVQMFLQGIVILLHG